MGKYYFCQLFDPYHLFKELGFFVVNVFGVLIIA